VNGLITVIGAGLAGAEAAWQAARRGARVRLYEMRPGKMTPAHKTGLFAELVCSNSLKSDSLSRGQGILKAELRRLGSLIMQAADRTRVPAGDALAVDRDLFAQAVTEAVEGEPLIEIVREEVTEIPGQGPVIIATGPLTSQPLARNLFRLTGAEYLFFYDAISPIVSAESIDRDIAWLASRYDKGEAAYWNCPLDREQYQAFYEALLAAEKTLHADYDPNELFEGCLPVEVIAARGPDTLRFGPMKPVGLLNEHTGEQPYAVVQLRPENNELTMYNLVGFQTSLKYGEQQRVFRMIPGLERAEFLRYGAVHRNTFINAPTLLLPTMQSRQREDLLFGGQITGVEGYLESTVSGWLAGVNAARLTQGKEPVALPVGCISGALLNHICTADPEHFQPMNANFGLLPPVERDKRKSKRDQRAERGPECLAALEGWLEAEGLL
jgi:methylenetetrahydrofolate--tRNA-(uracil-5-)-methyltransferase